ncbi:MAG: GyrI-like domain-containing protein [Methanomassiliicoccales archaeon]
MRDRLSRFADRRGIKTVGPPCTAYHRYGPEGIDVECGFPVDEEAGVEGEIHGGRLPGGRFAHILHVGPYQDLGEAYEKLDGWMNENGHRPNGLPREVYLHDPEDTDHHELRTGIFWPME